MCLIRKLNFVIVKDKLEDIQVKIFETAWGEEQGLVHYALLGLCSALDRLVDKLAEMEVQLSPLTNVGVKDMVVARFKEDWELYRGKGSPLLTRWPQSCSVTLERVRRSQLTASWSYQYMCCYSQQRRALFSQPAG